MVTKTSTLFRVNLRINKKMLDKIENVVEYARTQGVQLDPHTTRCWKYMIDRWDKVLGVLGELEKDMEQKKTILGRLK